MLVLILILAAAVVAAAVFLASTHRMHWTAFAATALVTLLLPLPVNAIWLALAKDSQQTFHEYWNGFETNAFTRDTVCQRDGVCTHTYDCDPYTVTEVEYYTDSDGKRQSRTVTKTKWHSCPYSTQETSFYVDSTLKTFTIASNLMTGEQFRWDAPIPGGRVTEAPALWQQAKARLDSGNPGPVSTVNDYKNYILNSETTLFKRYSELIDELKEKGQLPEPTKGIQGAYTADKLHFVGELQGVDRGALQAQLLQLNGAVGTDLRGDLHVVMVDADEMKASSEDYSNALLAYWQNPKIFGRDALAKNAIVLVVAVEGSTPEVAWARAFTGMPLGNEALLQQFTSELPGTEVTGNFFGSPKYTPSTETITHSDGVVEDILWGSNKFERVSMSAKDADDAGSGFAYLSDEWQPDTGTLVGIYIVSSILAAGALVGGIFLTMNSRNSGHRDFVRYLFSKH